MLVGWREGVGWGDVRGGEEEGGEEELETHFGVGCWVSGWVLVEWEVFYVPGGGGFGGLRGGSYNIIARGDRGRSSRSGV